MEQFGPGGQTGWFVSASQAAAEPASRTEFQPYQLKHRKPGTGGIYQINDHLWEGRYSPRGADGKRISRNIYAKTREECEEKLAVMIEEVKAEIAQQKEKRKQQSQSEMVTQ